MTDNRRASSLVLASQSPIRSRLLLDAGLRFEAIPARVDESGLIAANAGAGPEIMATILASAKADVLAQKRPDALVIGADQLLVVGTEILRKPEDREAARQRLSVLAGKTHRLVTGVALATGNRNLWRHVETATLIMHALSAAEIDRQLEEDGPEVLQSVGAYRLEGPGIRLFASIEGDYFAMLGLPVVPLLSALRRLAPQLLPGGTPT